FCCALGVGLLLVGTIIASWDPLVELDVYRSERHAAQTLVFNMRDELLLLPKGNPIGIRLKYSMRLPDSNYFWESPSMSSEQYLRVSIWTDLHMAALTVDPPMIRIGRQKYQKGTTYNLTVDMMPNCLNQNVHKSL